MSGKYVIPGYQLPAPVMDDFRSAVRQAAGRDFEDTWKQVCTAAGVPPMAAVLSQSQMHRLATTIATQPGVLGIVGRSLVVRLSTFRTLAALNGTSS